MLSHHAVIHAFGGSRLLAEAIGIDPARAIHWPRRGIPSRYWLLIEDAASQRGIMITARSLALLPPQSAFIQPQKRARNKTECLTAPVRSAHLAEI